MTNTEQPSLLVFNEDTGRILLNSVDITENVIHVMIKWFVHTEVDILALNKRTQQQMLITCVDVSGEDLSTNTHSLSI